MSENETTPETTPETTAPETPAKKPTPKPKAKKAPKAEPKAEPKAKKGKDKGPNKAEREAGERKKNPGGLTDNQLRVLKVLAKTSKGEREMSRAEIKAATGIKSGLYKLLGHIGEGETIEGALVPQGLVGCREVVEGKRGAQYFIMAKGKKLLEK